MCGLVGFLGECSPRAVSAFSELLQIDVLRGAHSTGVAVITDKGRKILKDTCLPHELLESKAWRSLKVPEWKGPICLMGHNRYATRGDKTADNAHPFERDKVILTHNGTVSTWRLDGSPRDFNTDSEHIAHSIDKDGPEKTWEKIEGAAALVWWDKVEKNLNILRNNDRPLWWVRLKDYSGLFWASEHWMLDEVLQRHAFEVEFLEEKDGTLSHVWKPVEHYHWTFKIKDGKVEEDAKKLKHFTQPIYNNRHACGYNQNQGRRYNSRRDEWDNYDGYGDDFSWWAHQQARIDDKKEAQWEGVNFDNFRPKVLIPNVWHCVFCGDVVNDFEQAVFIDEETPVCTDCFEVSTNELITYAKGA